LNTVANFSGDGLMMARQTGKMGKRNEYFGHFF